MEDIEQAVRSRYGAVASSNLSSENDGVRAVAEAFGYSPEELSSIPAAANMGLSCGNPTAVANLREGETVLDLGSGGGLDVFLAAAKVEPTGRAIGIDMTPEMIELARRNASRGNDGQAFTNVEFHLATIDRLPLPDNSVDCVISNCVINLAVDKSAVFREIARVLKPGGRLAVSDIALKQRLPREISEDVLAYVGCISGAILIEDYRRGLVEAGFTSVQVVDSGADLNAYAKIENQSGCCSPAAANISVESKALPVASACCTPEPKAGDETQLHNALADLLSRYNVNDYAASVKVYAIK
jgi:arsenite methyltransferase